MAKRKAFLLRVDPQVHDSLRRWAEDELRSLNAQVESLLRQALQQAGRLDHEAEAPPAGRTPPGHTPPGAAPRMPPDQEKPRPDGEEN